MGGSADLTVIYYTSNREDPAFEERIRRTALEEIGDLPLVSVSHDPLPGFGDNICVGRKDPHPHNVWRQVQLGAKKASTKFVCGHEADFLRPRAFYQFRPQRDDTFYVANPLYVLFTWGRRAGTFFLKSGHENSMIVGRETLIDAIEDLLKGRGEWAAPGDPPLTELPSRGRPRVEFQIDLPIVTFKTETGMHRKTPMAVHSRLTELPYWGSGKDLVRKYCRG